MVTVTFRTEWRGLPVRVTGKVFPPIEGGHHPEGMMLPVEGGVELTEVVLDYLGLDYDVTGLLGLEEAWSIADQLEQQQQR